MQLILTWRDLLELHEPRRVIEAVEEAFRLKALGEAYCPPKMYLELPGGDLRIMPAYIPAMNAAGVKVVNVHPGNPSKGIPTVMALVELVEPDSGRPIAVMDGTLLTAWRTGAAGAVAAKYLANPDSIVMGVIGAGVQGRMQVLYTSQVLPIQRVVVYDPRRSAVEEMERLCDELGLDVLAVEDPSAAAIGVDVLATCTPSRRPVIRAEWVVEGTHINAIGADAPGKEELDPAILARARIVVDDYEQAAHSGEVNVPLAMGYIDERAIYAELGEIVAKLKPGRLSPYEITVFDSTGIAVQDIATAKTLLDAALEKGVGLKLELVRDTL